MQHCMVRTKGARQHERVQTDDDGVHWVQQQADHLHCVRHGVRLAAARHG